MIKDALVKEARWVGDHITAATEPEPLPGTSEPVEPVLFALQSVNALVNTTLDREHLVASIQALIDAHNATENPSVWIAQYTRILRYAKVTFASGRHAGYLTRHLPRCTRMDLDKLKEQAAWEVRHPRGCTHCSASGLVADNDPDVDLEGYDFCPYCVYKHICPECGLIGIDANNGEDITECPHCHKVIEIPRGEPDIDYCPERECIC